VTSPAHRPGRRPATRGAPAAGVELPPGALARLFEPRRWLRDLGRTAWLVVGIGVVVVGLVWILGITASIVEPVVAGGVVAAVCSPGVAWLARHRVPRAAGAGLMLLALVAIAVGIFLLVVGGIVEQSSQIEASADQALDTIEGWANDADANGTSDTAQDVKIAVTGVGDTFLKGVAGGIEGLTSVAFFLSFTLFTLFFLLKDGPTIKRFVDRHLGVPVPVATIVTGEVLGSLRRYFVGVTIVAAFNAVVVGLGALLLGVPLAGTIAVVTFVTAYVPFIGAFVAGAFAVLIALGSEGSTTALIMLVIVILANGMLQQIVQPIAFGATLDINPLAVLIVTIAGGSLFGMVGLILAAPLTSAAVHVSRKLALARAGEPGAATSPPPEPA
jgi:putative heme transporter